MRLAMRRNLGDMLDPRGDPAKTVLIDVGPDGAWRHWRADALSGLFDAVARGLLARGLQRGDRVGVASLNRAEFAAVYFGAMRAGLVAVPINWKLPAETVAYIAADAEIKLFFADTERLGLAPATVPRTRTLPPVSGVPPTTTAVMALSSMLRPWLAGSASAPWPTIMTPGRLAVAPSGTSGPTIRRPI